MKKPSSAKLLERHLRAHAAGIPDPRRSGWKYASMEALVLGAGRSYSSQPLTTSERPVVQNAIRLFHNRGYIFESKLCFFNAQMLARLWRGGELVYVEGYRFDARLGSPILHGWVTINDKVIDPTAPGVCTIDEESGEPGRVLGAFNGHAYWGIPFDPRYVLKRSGGGGKDAISLIDDWQGGFPLVRDGLPPPRGRARRRP
jgi:hypothetical protein